MTTEELLKPRYKAIADYPGSQYSAGDILPVIGTVLYTKGWIEFFEQYPHLFKKLEWWEERKPEEMPEYLNCPSRKMFFKVESWHKSYFIIDGRQKMQYRNYLPATENEYNEYIKTVSK